MFAGVLKGLLDSVAFSNTQSIHSSPIDLNFRNSPSYDQIGIRYSHMLLKISTSVASGLGQTYLYWKSHVIETEEHCASDSVTKKQHALIRPSAYYYPGGLAAVTASSIILTRRAMNIFLWSLCAALLPLPFALRNDSTSSDSFLHNMIGRGSVGHGLTQF